MCESGAAGAGIGLGMSALLDGMLSEWPGGIFVLDSLGFDFSPGLLMISGTQW